MGVFGGRVLGGLWGLPSMTKVDYKMYVCMSRSDDDDMRLHKNRTIYTPN